MGQIGPPPRRVVEKDHVLGWLLRGTLGHPELADAWVFKGGPCRVAKPPFSFSTASG
jgi:hypothetical protein